MKILVLTANFAPRSASPAIRTVNLVTALHALGHAVSVVTYEPDDLLAFSPADAGLSAKVPESVDVRRIPAGRLRRRIVRRRRAGPARAASKRKLIGSPLSALMVPDPHIESVRTFVATAAAVVAETHPDAVVTFAYPFSLHVAGYLVKRRFPHLFWVADYGDPWSGGGVEELNRPGWRRRLDSILERRLLARADLVTLTTDATRLMYERRYPELGGRTAVVTMGYDPDDYADPPPFTDGLRRIVHVGRLYGDARDYMPFHDAVSALHAERPALFEDWRVSLVGEVEPRILDAVRSDPCSCIYEIVPWVQYRESLAWMRHADRLLLVGNKGGVQIPGKIYNYLGAGTPVLMTAERPDDPTALLLAGAPGCLVVPNRREDICAALPGLLAERPATRDTGLDRTHYTWESVARGLGGAMDARRSGGRP